MQSWGLGVRGLQALSGVSSKKKPTGSSTPSVAAREHQLGDATACAANVIFIALDDPVGMGKAAYATVLAAMATEKKISYLEYVQEASGICYLVQLEMA